MSKLSTKQQSLQHGLKRFADRVVRGAGTAPHIVLGPAVYELHQGRDTKHWYFVVATSDADGDFRTDQLTIGNDDRAFAEEVRDRLMLEFIDRSQPAVLHISHDELEMARLCEAIWPCEKTQGIRQAIEGERQAEAVA